MQTPPPTASPPQGPPPPQAPPPGSNAWGPPPVRGPAPGLAYAGFGVRLVAWIIDAIIIGLLTGFLSAILGLGFLVYGADWRTPAPMFPATYSGAWLAWLVIQALISGAYFVYGWTRWGASAGQRIMNLQVRMDTDGALLTQDTAIKRWALLTVPVVNALPGLGFFIFLYQIYLAWTTANDSNKQGFHDHQCGTVVVQAV